MPGRARGHHKIRRDSAKFGGVWPMTTCEGCKKVAYRTRSEAKKAIRILHPSDVNKMSAYRCPAEDGAGFHIGHLSDQVKAGKVGREVYGR